MIRLASFERDFWQLRSGEETFHQHPKTFKIPPLEQRQNLQRGQAARLIFDIEYKEENDNLIVQGERMWVIVAEKINGIYIGILDNQPACLETGDDAYLCFGAELPFQAEHVIDIGQPPAEYIEWQLGQSPAYKWLRGE